MPPAPSSLAAFTVKPRGILLLTVGEGVRLEVGGVGPEVNTWRACEVVAICALPSQTPAVLLNFFVLQLQICEVHIYLLSSFFKLLEEVSSIYPFSATPVPFCVNA